MRSLLLCVFLILIFFASACNEDSFSQIVDIPIPEHEPLPAMTLALQAGDTAAYARLGLSRGILEDVDFDDQRLATLELYQDDILIGTTVRSLAQDAFGRNVPPMPITTPINGEPATYRLVGTVDGFAPVTATQVMPPVPSIENLAYEADGAIDTEGFRVDELIFDLVDESGTQNYYAFRVGYQAQSCTYDPIIDSLTCVPDTSRNELEAVYIESPNPLLSGGLSNDLLLSDQSFDGQRYQVRLWIDNYRDDPITLEVLHLTEDAYRYSISYAAYLEAGDNPFSEPVQVHGNVDGGYGVFSVANVLQVPVE